MNLTDAASFRQFAYLATMGVVKNLVIDKNVQPATFSIQVVVGKLSIKCYFGLNAFVNSSIRLLLLLIFLLLFSHQKFLSTDFVNVFVTACCEHGQHLTVY